LLFNRATNKGKAEEYGAGGRTLRKGDKRLDEMPHDLTQKMGSWEKKTEQIEREGGDFGT
jgi:hypothetical protein